MPQPTLSDVHVNVPLSNLTLMYDQMDDAFVADRVFPILPVEQRSDVYYKYLPSDFVRNQMALRAPGAESAGSGYRLDNTGTYLCQVWSLHKDIPDQIRANADAVLNLDFEATKFLSDMARLNREIQWANTFFTTSVWTTAITGASTGGGSTVTAISANAATWLQWNDAASTPIEDVRAAKRNVQLAGLYRPNKIVLGRTTFDVLLDHPDIKERIKYGQTGGPGNNRPAIATREILAQIFELDEVLVMDGIQNTTTEGIAEASQAFSFIAGKNALLIYSPPSAGIMTACSGLTFAWTGYLGASAFGTRIKSFYLPWLESTRVEVDNAFIHKCVAPNLGCFFNGIVA